SVVSGVLMLLALFFFFRDGERMSAAIRDLLPMDAEHKHEVFGRVYDTLTAVVQSMVVNAVVQGLLGGFGYWAIGGAPVPPLRRPPRAVLAFPPAVRRRVHLGAGRRLPHGRRTRRTRRVPDALGPARDQHGGQHHPAALHRRPRAAAHVPAALHDTRRDERV